MRARANNKLMPAFIAAWLAFSAASGADTIYSNGTGGGLWSEKTTWRGGSLPGPQDVAMISARDIVTVDMQFVQCGGLELDPLGVLVFQSGDVDRVLGVSGPVEDYGTIKIDATTSTGLRELRLLAKDEKDRRITVQKNASLLLYGAKGLPEGKCNVRVSTGGTDPDGKRRLGVIQVQRASLDFQRVANEDVRVVVRDTDNTGYKAHEKMNIIGCNFTGLATIELYGCDTPMIKETTLRYADKAVLDASAIYLSSCAQAQLTRIEVAGAYARGIYLYGGDSISVNGATVTGCRNGLSLGQTWNVMVKQVTIADCEEGMWMQASGVIEETTVTRPKAAGIKVQESSPQFTACAVFEPAEKAMTMWIDKVSVWLLNCNIDPAKVQRSDRLPADGKPWAEAFQFCTVAVKGNRQPDTQVSVRTAGLAENAPDPNVRNSPAMLLPNDMTPLPKSPQSITVRSWVIGPDGKVQPAPSYAVTVWDPPAKKGDKPAVRASATVTPDASWYRPGGAGSAADAARPTVEVTLQ